MATVALDSNQTQAPLKIRINRRGWAVLVGMPIFALTIAAAFFISMFASDAHAAADTPVGVGTVDVTVIPGDTLWSLARDYATGYDVTSAVGHIAELNALTGSEIQVGETLSIPVLAG
ncbi:MULTISPECIES: LysM peptidoglycan-binding domain-containing protein [Micrococcaceae]|uniref:LysM peptidoglycan-binding domain-containing protein n=1 Tax=Micrococcaceae TaxID=1268 RepID=UPI000CFA9B32|nr:MULTISPECIES: LysM peptidoglycan-binding domain-containing protein [unclassified Arthrobacter]MCS3492769.1 hypothetical protein [Arthrobacter sp. JUb119]PQZ86245.1 peptidoglycan-binding protein LysM [Arthrobacter sp. MYb222]PRB77030.1 peptidoglycan-binding protein LysM [Arthrobacter sp. MYb214]TDU30091.1 LysM domain-containing protein [Arthrobacter sp. JUb115]